MDIGARLKAARESRGKSLRDVAAVTKISVLALEALERNDFSRLPGGIFARAFLRSCAGEVGLDPEPLVREFVLQYPGESWASIDVPLTDATAAPSSGRRWMAVVVALALLGAAVAAGTYFWGASRPGTPNSSSPGRGSR